MATYRELREIHNGPGDLIQRVEAAVAIAAEGIYKEATDGPRKAFADEVYSGHQAAAEMANKILWALLSQNRNQTVDAIKNASDSSVQTAVNNYVTDRYGLPI